MASSQTASEPPTNASCPIPTVSSALDPYIRSRQEVLLIRSLITSKLLSTANADIATHKSKSESSPWNPQDVSTTISQLALGYPPGITTTSSKDGDDFLGGPNLGLSPGAGSGAGAGYTPQTVRKYMSAMAALRKAHVRYNGVKSEISELREHQEQVEEYGKRRRTFSLKKDGASPSKGDAEKASNDVQSRLTALRLSKRKARLEAVGKAVEGLNSLSSNPSTRDVKLFVKEVVGEVPEPPSSAPMTTGDPADSAAGKELDGLVFELKKALVLAGQREKKAREEERLARERCERVVARVEQHYHTQGVPRGVRIKAMAKGRDDLVAWMEEELAKVAAHDQDNDEEEEDSETHQNGNGERHDEQGDEEDEKEMTNDDVHAQVQEMYQIYISARKELVARVGHLQQQRENISPNSAKNAPESTQTRPPLATHSRHHSRHLSSSNLLKSAAPPSISASQLLPYLPSLFQTSRDETTLMQQTTHLRKQVNMSASETQSSLQRLAGESHLVPPGTQETEAWKRAATEFAEQTETSVKEWVDEGNKRVAGAKEVIGEKEGRRRAVEMVKGKMGS
jgi:hypothetical protein